MDDTKSTRSDLLAKWLPRLAFIISLCAFIFQVTVLYPWHLELSAEFAKLAASVKNCSR